MSLDVRCCMRVCIAQAQILQVQHKVLDVWCFVRVCVAQAQILQVRTVYSITTCDADYACSLRWVYTCAVSSGCNEPFCTLLVKYSDSSVCVVVCACVCVCHIRFCDGMNLDAILQLAMKQLLPQACKLLYLGTVSHCIWCFLYMVCCI
jgi:hypothetical protein